ncbi:MAG: hypothetical protein HY057_01810 [Rhodospirillales bacterium]|nr:hypothetical protein [Rhodospirillales bacterium]
MKPLFAAAPRALTLATPVFLLFFAAAFPTVAQAQMPAMNPFAAAPGAPGAMMAPYGTRAGALPHILQSTPGLMDSIAGHQMNLAARPEGGEATEAPDVDSRDESFWELIAGACAGGAFIGAYAAITAASAAAPAAVGAVAVAAAPVSAPAAITAVAGAAGIGCSFGVTTAIVSLGGVVALRRATGRAR